MEDNHYSCLVSLCCVIFTQNSKLCHRKSATLSWILIGYFELKYIFNNRCILINKYNDLFNIVFSQNRYGFGFGTGMAVSYSLANYLFSSGPLQQPTLAPNTKIQKMKNLIQCANTRKCKFYSIFQFVLPSPTPHLHSVAHPRPRPLHLRCHITVIIINDLNIHPTFSVAITTKLLCHIIV